MTIGLYPQTTGMTHYAAIEIPERYQTIPALFREAGYTTVGVVAIAVLDSDLGRGAGLR
jgi:arylsulfatase A-like enzyme